MTDVLRHKYIEDKYILSHANTEIQSESYTIFQHLVIYIFIEIKVLSKLDFCEINIFSLCEAIECREKIGYSYVYWVTLINELSRKLAHFLSKMLLRGILVSVFNLFVQLSELQPLL